MPGNKAEESLAEPRVVSPEGEATLAPTPVCPALLLVLALSQGRGICIPQVRKKGPGLHLPLGTLCGIEGVNLFVLTW